MSYTTSKGVHVDAIERTWTQSAQSADANGDAIELGRNRSCTATLSVTAVSGSDTLDAKIQGSLNGSTWFDIVAFTQVTAAPATESKTFTGARYVRAVFDVTGSGISISSTIALEAV